MALWWQVSQIVCPAALISIIVSVGPTNAENVTIVGPSSFITDGTRSMILTCVATDLHPSPAYSWGGLCATNTANCTFTPTLDQDGGDVLCIATNPDTNISEQEIYTLNLIYPPPEAPMITTDTNNIVLLSGDKITCTVTGGKPLVKSVLFNCNNPFLADQDDVIGNTSVSSSFTVNSSTTNEFPIHCNCSAIWDPEQGLYLDSKIRTFILGYPPPEGPVITTDTNNTVLLSGDKVSCTVTGGKPLVKSVMFTCTNPFLADQDDVIGNTSVSSSVMVYTLVANEFPMHCNCSAVWGPKPEVYFDSSNRTFLLDPLLADDINILLVAGCAAAGGVFIMSLVVIVCICWCRKGHHADKHSAETDERAENAHLESMPNSASSIQTTQSSVPRAFNDQTETSCDESLSDVNVYSNEHCERISRSRSDSRQDRDPASGNGYSNVSPQTIESLGDDATYNNVPSYIGDSSSAMASNPSDSNPSVLLSEDSHVPSDLSKSLQAHGQRNGPVSIDVLANEPVESTNETPAIRQTYPDGHYASLLPRVDDSVYTQLQH